MMLSASLAPYLGMVCMIAGAVLAAGALVWIARYGDRTRPDRESALAAATLTALWCVLGAALGADAPATELIATARNLAFIAMIFRLFSADGRDESLRPIRPVIFALVLVELLQPVTLAVELRVGAAPVRLDQAIFEASTILAMLVAIGALVLLHNLYAGAAAASREVLRWSGIALAGVFGYDLNLHTIAYLGGESPEALVALRGLFTGAMVGLLAIGANARGASLQLRPSRAVTFQTLSLLVIGSYLAVMVLVTRSLALIGGDIARTGQVVFLVIAIVCAVIWLPSERVRSWIRVMATKHLFQHRYDYRAEWLRFTRTIGHGSGGSASFQQRAVKAIADITDSPAGLLLVPNEEAQLELTARWNWPTIEVPAIAGEYALSGLLEMHHHILDLDEVRAGIDHHGEAAEVPAWLREAEDAWALVPLIHFERLVGAIVLARPRTMRRLDWEDFDLLRVAGQQLASYLAEQAGQQALMDASRFDEFNRRMAFVMHDIKNLASQMSLLAANAEKHADNPAFRADMLVTLRKSSEKLTALLARLGRYGTGPVQERSRFDLAALAGGIADRFAGGHPVTLTKAERVEVIGDRDALEQALIHLVQNAIDASEADVPVRLDAVRDGITGRIDIVDSGHGMSPEFVRNSLFKPFVSSKQGGFGIGAFEAREMIRAMGGRLTVESREGLGSRFSVTLPLPEAARLDGTAGTPATAPQNEVA
ncbi:XrtA/PEP-CTERM system histidine kinase PrsK [Erythrobacter sp. HL-111]|uniref:XrtA/PEP-CTERM system histidine kinase PrsK n=1 Tax=Erythrobacter sp. HL-111 TaxID=1798193 RepID=UPI0006D9AE14|nr:XrtA/PEP-CTERM system histidine kinase PrsK [Erythrobacter sp. HL-111]KPP89374.1 MAG: putative PEP-CTERM system histidine kinase [Erythrobacteraceae bacterium HL-111]SDR87129.1 putative PEP-CTERM system histidine kinase [Erythrobacter sp. HL-111]